MIIKFKKFYPKDAASFDYNPIDTVYYGCTFIGINFKNVDDLTLLFGYCKFYYCTFHEHPFYRFDSCAFNNCTFKGTFISFMYRCDFLGVQPYVPLICPTEGSFIGWKVTHITKVDIKDDCIDYKESPCIIKLLIPADAKRSSAGGRKCRCSKAIVLDMRKLDGTPVEVAYSMYNNSFQYKLNKLLIVEDFDENRWHECAPGIHFFMTEEEARKYYY